MLEIIQKVKQIYPTLNKDNLDLLEQIYTQDIVFVDPVSKVDGLQNLTQHFANTYANVAQIDFVFSDDNALVTKNMAYLNWQMRFVHPKLNKSQSIEVNGVSLLRYSDKVFYHRDWFDMGEMVYQHIPVLGKVINSVNKRLKA